MLHKSYTKIRKTLKLLIDSMVDPVAE